MNLELVPASPAHIGTIAARLRDWDRIEQQALGMTPKAALRLALRQSLHTVTAKVDGRAEAMFGLQPVSAFDRTGHPWMLGTDVIYQHGRDLLGMGPTFIAQWRDSTRNLSNIVGADNARAIRLLRRWGFEVGGETQMIGGLAFVTFKIGG